MALLSAIQGSHTLSRYGDRSITILPSVLPAALLQAPGGLHRFEPVIWTGSLPPRAMLLTRQGISLNIVAHAMRSLAWGPSISVGLCMSPYSSDFIINLLRHRRLSGVKSLRIPHCSARTFLLIICTPSIVTADCSASSWRFSDVPAYGQILLRQRSHLRTVIVTAAVYRGFASELRLAAVPSG